MDNNNNNNNNNNIADLLGFWARGYIAKLEASEKLVGLIEKKIAEHLSRAENCRVEAANGLKHAHLCERKRMDWLMIDLIMPSQDNLPPGKWQMTMNL
jgi:hypothetical protein